MPEFTQLPWCKAVVFIAIAAAGILALSHTTLRGRTRGGDSTVLGSVMEMDTVGGIAKASVGGGAALRNKHSTTRGSRAHRAHMHNTADGSQVDILEEDDIVASDSASGSGYEWVYEYRSETVTLTDYETMTVEMDARYTTRGCRCAVSWAYKGEDCETQCCDFGDEKGAWCAIEDPIECRATKGSPQNWGYCSEPGADPDALLGDSALDHHVKEPKKVTVQQVDTLSVAEGSDSALRSTERK